MSVGSISSPNISALAEQFQNFKSGKTNLQKSDLTDLKAAVDAVAPAAGKPIQKILDSFERIDKNQDGISSQELKDFSKAQGGPPPDAAGEQAGRAGGSRGHRGPPMEGGMAVMVLMPTQAGGPPGGPSGAGGGASPAGGGQESLQKLVDLFKAMDSDQDGKVSLQELLQFAESATGSESGNSSGTAGTQDPSADPIDAAESASGDGQETGSSRNAGSDQGFSLISEFLKGMGGRNSQASAGNQGGSAGAFHGESAQRLVQSYGQSTSMRFVSASVSSVSIRV